MSPAITTPDVLQLVVFSVAHQRCALELARVERVLRMVALEPLPDAPSVILGVFDLHGEVIPAAGVRHRLGLPDRPVSPRDRLIVLRTERRRIALAVDAVHGVADIPRAQLQPAQAVMPGLEFVRGITRLEDGLVVVHDVDHFLSLEDEVRTGQALSAFRA